MRPVVLALCAALLVSACGAGDDPADGGGGAAFPTRSSETPASETPAGETPAGETPAGETPATETPATETPASSTGAEEPAAPVELTQRCRSPLGFAVSHPASWSVNSGATVPACTRFAPEPFTVPPATDVRVAAVTASVEAAPFDLVAGPAGARVASRAETTVDGRPAVRIERVSTGQGLYAEGVRSTAYVVRLDEGADGPRTLVVNTIGLPQFDYARNVAVLDRMIETLDVLEP